MKFSSVCILGVLAGLVCSTAGVPDAYAESKQSVGIVLPLTGPLGEHGHAALEGFKMGLEDGGCAASKELIVEDDGYDPKRSLAAIQKILSTEKPQAMVIVGTGAMLAAANITDEAKIPFLVVAADSKGAKARQYIIRLRPPAAYEGRKIAGLVEKHHAKSAVLVCSSNEFTLNICASIEKELGGIIKDRIDLLTEDSDFKSITAKIVQAKPDVVLPIIVPGKLGIFAKQLREVSPTGTNQSPQLIGGVFFESSTDLKLANGALVGSNYIMLNVADDFRQRYMKLPGATEGSIGWAGTLHDAGKILCQSSGGTKSTLETFTTVKDFDGAVGRFSYVSQDGDQYLELPLVEKAITAQGFAPLG